MLPKFSLLGSVASFLTAKDASLLLSGKSMMHVYDGVVCYIEVRRGLFQRPRLTSV